MNIYHECIQITRQFTFCPNAFRVDLYKGCDFGCRYCFANMEWAEQKKGADNWAEANFAKLQRIFYNALETDKVYKDVLVELLRHRVPIHCGGMSDPFQSREQKFGLTRRFIELSNKYSYPVQFSTKTANLPVEYYDILNPDIHAFQISLAGWDDEYIRKWELNTPTAVERFKFIKELKNRGFWVGVRIQPIIEISQALAVVNNLKELPDYYSIEHFKSLFDNYSSMEAFFALCNNPEDFETSRGKLQTKANVKRRNIEQIINAANEYGVKVGVGDNDFHYLSQSRCCCGVDCINGNFDNYLKYNLTYMSTGDDWEPGELWAPICNPKKHINDQKSPPVVDCKEYTNDYIRNNAVYLGNRRTAVEKKLFGMTQRRLI